MSQAEKVRTEVHEPFRERAKAATSRANRTKTLIWSVTNDFRHHEAAGLALD